MTFQKLETLAKFYGEIKMYYDVRKILGDSEDVGITNNLFSDTLILNDEVREYLLSAVNRKVGEMEDFLKTL